MAPAHPDRVLDVPAPLRCPGCGGETELERIAEQFQTELPEPRPVTTFVQGARAALSVLCPARPGAPP